MANIKSQIKRNLTNEKARTHNAAIKSSVRTAIKKVEKAIAANEVDNAKALFIEAAALIDKAVTSDVFSSQSGARKKSSLQRRLNELK